MNQPVAAPLNRRRLTLVVIIASLGLCAVGYAAFRPAQPVIADPPVQVVTNVAPSAQATGGPVLPPVAPVDSLTPRPSPLAPHPSSPPGRPRREWFGFLAAPSRWVTTRGTPDESPAHSVTLDGFWMDRTEVTNAQFKTFVDATHYVTVAERTPKREDFRGAVPNINDIPAENLVAGSICFNERFDRRTLTKDDPLWPYQVWKYVKGANWKHPEGPATEHRRPHAASGRARLVGRRGRLLQVGRQTAADRGRMGIRRPRRAQGRRPIRGATNSCGTENGCSTSGRGNSRIRTK